MLNYLLHFWFTRMALLRITHAHELHMTATVEPWHCLPSFKLSAKKLVATLGRN